MHHRGLYDWNTEQPVNNLSFWEQVDEILVMKFLFSLNKKKKLKKIRFWRAKGEIVKNKKGEKEIHSTRNLWVNNKCGCTALEKKTRLYYGCWKGPRLCLFTSKRIAAWLLFSLDDFRSKLLVLLKLDICGLLGDCNGRKSKKKTWHRSSEVNTDPCPKEWFTDSEPNEWFTHFKSNEWFTDSKPKEWFTDSKPNEWFTDSKSKEWFNDSKPNKWFTDSKPNEWITDSKPNEWFTDSKPDKGDLDAYPLNKWGNFCSHLGYLHL